MNPIFTYFIIIYVSEVFFMMFMGRAEARQNTSIYNSRQIRNQGWSFIN